MYPRVVIESPGPFFSYAQPTGLTGTHWIADTYYGSHIFDRYTGEWVAGPCLNFKGGRIMPADLEKLEDSAWSLVERDPECQAAVAWEDAAAARAKNIGSTQGEHHVNRQ